MEQKVSAHNLHNRSTMEASSRSLWQCSTCIYAENMCAAVECAMCGAVVHAKRPASPILSSDAVASKLSKATKKPPPQVPPLPTHPSGVVVDIVGTNRSDRGRSCEEHPDGCGAVVLMDDIVVRIRKEQILVEDYLLGKGRMRDCHFANLLTAINCKLAWMMEGELGRMRSWGDAVSLVRSSN